MAKILIVENNQGVLSQLEQYLTDRGHTVESEVDWRAGISLLKSTPDVNAVLIQFGYPAIQFHKNLPFGYENVTTIVYSSLSTEDVSLSMHNAGAREATRIVPYATVDGLIEAVEKYI